MALFVKNYSFFISPAQLGEIAVPVIEVPETMNTILAKYVIRKRLSYG